MMQELGILPSNQRKIGKRMFLSDKLLELQFVAAAKSTLIILSVLNPSIILQYIFAQTKSYTTNPMIAEVSEFGQLGLPVGSALAMEYQSRKFVLRKCLCIWLTPIALPCGCVVLENGLITSPVYRFENGDYVFHFEGKRLES